jgi:NADH-quinone oxidoreductase subunit A
VLGSFQAPEFFCAMLPDYIPVVLQILIASGFAVATLIASALLGKRALTNPTKDSAYECGMNPVGDGQARFSVKFYLVAMLFVLFDIEVVFLYPWAVVFKEQISGGATIFFWAMFGFVMILFVAYLYALKKGALEWRK